MDPEILIMQLNSCEEFLNRSTASLSEEDSSFQPTPEMLTAAQQIGHIAHTIDWFIQGGFRPEGFDTDFEAMEKAIKAVTSLDAARAWAKRSFEAARQRLSQASPDELMRPLPEGPVMGGAPVMSIVGGIEDHTAHHRGALTVYARLVGKVPAMPYMDM